VKDANNRNTPGEQAYRAAYAQDLHALCTMDRQELNAGLRIAKQRQRDPSAATRRQGAGAARTLAHLLSLQSRQPVQDLLDLD